MRLARILLSLALIVPALHGQCGIPGARGVPSLSFTNDLWDAPMDLVIENGAHGAPIVVLADLSNGPTQTPIGALCVGRAPVVIASSFDGTAPPLDGHGRAEIPLALTPDLAPLIGVPLFIQALVLDPAAPASVAATPSTPLSIRSPRIFIARSSSNGASISFDVSVRDLDEVVAGTSTTPGSSFAPSGFARPAVSSRGNVVLLGEQVPLLGVVSEPAYSLWDTTTAPAVELGRWTLPPCFGFCVSRAGTPMSLDARSAHVVVSGSVVARLDLDPASPTFMTPLETIPTSQQSIRALSRSFRGPSLLAVGAGQTPATLSVIDPNAAVEIGVVTLTSSASAMFDVRNQIDVSADQRLAVITSTEFDVSIVDIDPTSADYLTEIQTLRLPDAHSVQFDPQDSDRLFFLRVAASGQSSTQRVVHFDRTTETIVAETDVTGPNGGGARQILLTALGNHIVVDRGLNLVVLNRALQLVASAPTGAPAFFMALDGR